MWVMKQFLLIKSDLEKVWVLFLGRIKITDAGFEEVAKLRQLEDLALQGAQIAAAGLKELANFRSSKRLPYMDPGDQCEFHGSS